MALSKVADAKYAQSKTDDARRFRAREVSLWERLGNVRERAMALEKLAAILFAQGNLDEAIRVLQHDVLPTHQQLKDRRLLIVGRTNLATVLLTRRQTTDDWRYAIALLATSLRDASELQTPEAHDIAELLRQLGFDPE